MEHEKTTREKFKEILETTVIRNYDGSAVNDEKIKNFCSQVHELKPERLFRYREFDDNTFEALQKNLITSSKPKYFNDPYDSLLYVDKSIILNEIKDPRNRWKMQRWLEFNPQLTSLFTKKQKEYIKALLTGSERKYLLRIKKSSDQLEKSLNISVTNCIQYIKEFQNIACLSETQTSPTMWAHYAKSHTGFVVEYDFKNYNSPCINCHKKCTYQHYELLFPVIYSDERFDAKNYVASFWSQQVLGNSKVEIFIPKDDELALYKVLLYKSTDWQYEKEWRIISQCSTFPNIIQKPIAIYLGVNIEKDNKQKLIDFAKKNNIETYEMYIDNASNKFQMNYRKI